MEESKEIINYIMSSSELENIPLFVFSNKSDLAEKKPQEIIRDISLHSLKGHEWML